MFVTFEDGIMYSLKKETIFSWEFVARDVSFSLRGYDAQFFSIHHKTGEISFAPTFDWEPKQTEFTIRVEMSVDGKRQTSHVYEVTIGEDLQDKAPPSNITVTTPLTLKINENDNSSLFEWLRGTSSDGPVKFRLADDYDGPLDIVSDILYFKTFHEGEHVTGFDYETDGAEHMVQAEAYDGTSTIDLEIAITIEDVYEAPVVL